MATKDLNLNSPGVSVKCSDSGFSWTSTTVNTSKITAMAKSAMFYIYIDISSAMSGILYSKINSVKISFKANSNRDMWAQGKVFVYYRNLNNITETLIDGETIAHKSSTSSSHSATISADKCILNGEIGLGILFYNLIAANYNYYYLKDVSLVIDYTEHTHSYTAETARTPSTCCTKGSVTKKCSCGATQKTELALDPNNHSGGTEVRNAKSATCTATGYTGDTYCKGCGVKISSGTTIAKKAHTEVTIPAVAATCTATGLASGKKCSVCGTVTVAQQTVAKNPNNHSGSQTTLSAVAPTCTDTGKTEGKKWSCCNAIITAQQTVPAKGHSYTSQVIAATAAVDGYTLHTCQNGCGSSYKDNYTINKIFYGTKQPSKIFFGTQEVKEVYFGTTKVFGPK